MRGVLIVVAGLLATTAVAETARPYAGQESRPIAALSAERIEGLRQGRGLGYAKAAEINGWPGPMHVLDLARELGLDATTEAEVAAIRAEMLAEAVPLGAALIEAEADLDRLFRDGAPDRAAVKAATDRIGAIEASLRAAHLTAHLRTAPLLTADQRARYARKRGYAGHSGHSGHSGHAGHARGAHGAGVSD